MSRRLAPIAAAGLAATLLLTSCGAGTDDAAAEPDAVTGGNAAAPGGDVCPDTLRFSDTGVEGLETLVLEFEDFRLALEEATGKDVEFYPISSRTAAATALEFDEIDLLLTGPAEYVVLRQEADALPVVGVTRPDYSAILIAKTEDGMEEVSDLKGKTVLTKEVGSTSGHLGPLEMLVDGGLEPGVDVEVVPLDSTRIEAFVGGEGDALGTGLKDFEEVEEEMGEGSVSILAEGPPLPNDLFVAGETLGEECVTWLQETLTENQDVLLEAIVKTGENDKYLESEFVVADDEDYDPTRVAYEAAGFTRYADLPDEDEQ